MTLTPSSFMSASRVSMVTNCRTGRWLAIRQKNSLQTIFTFTSKVCRSQNDGMLEAHNLVRCFSHHQLVLLIPQSVLMTFPFLICNCVHVSNIQQLSCYDLRQSSIYNFLLYVQEPVSGKQPLSLVYTSPFISKRVNFEVFCIGIFQDLKLAFTD